MTKEDIDTNKTIEHKRPAYEHYIEYNEGLEWKRENVNIDKKYDIVKILKPNNDAEIKSLDKKLLADIKFPVGHIFSMAGRKQIQDNKEFNQLFTLSIKVCDSNNKELSPESRIIINKEKDIDEYDTRVARLESTFYKNVSTTKFCKELPNSIKTIDELYKFEHGAEFKEDEYLRIYVVDSDIDISPENVELNINIDKWSRN